MTDLSPPVSSHSEKRTRSGFRTLITTRVKSISILVTILGAAIVLLGWSQTWFTVALINSSAQDVTGSAAAPALSALAFAALALAAALSLANRWTRFVLGIVELAIGVGAIILVVVTLTAPENAVSSSITKATGVSGATRDLITSLTSSLWPYVAAVGGAILAVVSFYILIIGKQWLSTTRRYERPGKSTGSEWDQLSIGADPTAG